MTSVKKTGRRVHRKAFLADTVIVAIGERVDTPLLTRLGLAVSKYGYLEATHYGYKTNLENVWAIGDVVYRPSTAAQAMGQARKWHASSTKVDGHRPLCNTFHHVQLRQYGGENALWGRPSMR